MNTDQNTLNFLIGKLEHIYLLNYQMMNLSFSVSSWHHMHCHFLVNLMKVLGFFWLISLVELMDKLVMLKHDFTVLLYLFPTLRKCHLEHPRACLKLLNWIYT